MSFLYSKLVKWFIVVSVSSKNTNMQKSRKQSVLFFQQVISKIRDASRCHGMREVTEGFEFAKMLRQKWDIIYCIYIRIGLSRKLCWFNHSLKSIPETNQYLAIRAEFLEREKFTGFELHTWQESNTLTNERGTLKRLWHYI